VYGSTSHLRSIAYERTDVGRHSALHDPKRLSGWCNLDDFFKCEQPHTPQPIPELSCRAWAKGAHEGNTLISVKG
jgi:hypothetical protein